MPISLIHLPYAHDALAPHISSATLKEHHGAHHKGYVDKVNEAIEASEMAAMPIEEIVRTAHKAGNAEVFNPAAQTWNHGFFWKSLTPAATKPSGALADAIARDFGSIAALTDELTHKAEQHFASGWAWLVVDGGKLGVTTTSDAETPLTGSANPLLTIDVWEHAYYLDVQSKRGDYLTRVVDHLLNWDFASENFARGSAWTYPD